jgi:amino acid adenylation domain-containing protein
MTASKSSAPRAAATSDPFAGGALVASAPTTDAQREILAVARLGTDANLAYNEGTRLSLSGAVDRARLRSALESLYQRHDALRMTFSRDGEAFFVWARDLVIETREVGHDAEGAARPDGAARRLATEPFDLDQGPLFRAVLLHAAVPGPGVELVLLAHHAVCDGWSLGVLATELLTLYRDPAAPLPPAPSYVAYATRERGLDASAATAFWTQQFEGSVPRMDLPTEAPRRPLREYRSERLELEVSQSVVADLRRLAARQQVTFFATLLAGTAATMSRLSAEDEVVLAVPTAGQPAAAMPGLVGHCVNVLPVRLYVDAQEKVGALVRRAALRLLDVQEHQEFTIGRLLRTVAIPRVPGRVPVTPVMFNLDQAPVLDALLAGTGVGAQAHPIARASEYFELFINLVQHDGRPLVIECQYNAALFSKELVREWLDGYVALLGTMAANAEAAVGSLDPIAPRTVRALESEWQGERLAAPEVGTVHDWILRRARARPDRVAVEDGALTLSYGALASRAETLAQRLRAVGAAPGARVAVSVSRTAMLPVALLGVMASGAAYVPLDPEYPAERLRFLLADSAPIAWVVDGDLPAGVEAGAAQVVDLRAIDWESAAELPPIAMDPEREAAYVIHTSGSTGRPKGVVVPHAAVLNFLAAMPRVVPLDESDRFLAITTLSFDIAVLELLLPLALGATCCVVDRATARDPRALAAALTRFGTTVAQATPTTWRLLLEDGWTGAPGLKALCGGESLPPELAERLRPSVGRLWNVFGPTETTVWSTVQEVDAVGAVVPVVPVVPIGRPIANTRVEVVDARGRRAPIGVPGEILIGGRGLALGYHSRADLTAERFVAHPAAGGQRMYRTGDLGAWRADGTLRHLGRLDGQVKIRGFRVELGEVEAVLEELAGVAMAAARTWDDGQGEARLVGFVVPAAGASLATDALARALRERLPEHMVPAQLVVLDTLPLTPNGKVDRALLPRPVAAAAAAPEPGWTETERVVAAVWSEVLGVPVTRRTDDFFALGGHSILVARAVARIERRLGIEIGLRRLFEATRLAEFAASLPAVGAWEEITL